MKKVIYLISLLFIISNCIQYELKQNPSTPYNLSGNYEKFNNILLTWETSENDIEYFEIKKQPGNKTIKINGNERSFLDSDPDSDSNFYRIKSVNKYGESGYTNEFFMNTSERKLVAYWNFDDNVNNIITNTEPSASLYTSYVPGIKNKALSFVYMDPDPAPTYINFDNEKSIALGSQTICFWTKWQEQNGEPTPYDTILRRTNTDQKGLMIKFQENLIVYLSDYYYYFKDKDDNNYNFEPEIWHFITITVDFDNKLFRFYHNGDFYSTVLFNPNEPCEITDGKFWIGRYNQQCSSTWNGQIDELKYFNYILNQDEIKYLYNQYQDEME